jgi:hypothetical protein
MVDKPETPLSITGYLTSGVYMIMIALALWIGTAVSDLSINVKLLSQQVGEISRVSDAKFTDHEIRIRSLEARKK